MAFLESDAKNISSGWPAPQQLHAPEIGTTLAAILTNRRLQQQQTQEALTAAIKAQQDRNSSAAYIQAAQNAGVLPQGDYSGMTEKAASDLAQRIQDQTPDTDMDKLHQAMAKYYGAKADEPYAPRGGAPRYDYNGVQLTGEQYIKQRQADAATAQYGKLVQAESDANGKVTLYQKKYGVDPDSGQLMGNPTPQDVQDYLQANQDSSRLKQQRTTYEKLHHGALHPDEVPTQQPDDDEDGGSTVVPPVTVTQPPPQTGASPPPQAQQTPGITPSPIPGTSPQSSVSPPPVSAGSAGGHAPSYGVNPQQVRQMAIAALQKVGQPQTEANIQAAIQQITGGH